MTKVRVGLIGLGRFGRLHTEILASLPEVELAAVCDVRPEALTEVATEFDVPIRVSDYEVLLAGTAVLDAVLIATPDPSHAPMAKLALERGLHVFVEKPLAMSYDEASVLARTAREAGRHLQVGFVLRYEPRHAYLKEQIGAGRLGHLATLRLKRHVPQAWFHTYGRTVHPMLESTIHDIDLCVWYIGSPCQRVYAVDRSFLGLDRPDTSLAMLEFEGGTVAVVDASWLLPAGAPQTTPELGGTIDASLEIVGTEATARLDFLNPSFSVWTREGTAYPELSLWPHLMGSVRGALREEVTDFIHSVRTGQASTIASVDEAVAGLAIVEAIQLSAHEQRPVQLTEVKDQLQLNRSAKDATTG